MPDPKFTPRQLRHIDEYLVDLVANASAIRAGYSTSWANKQAAKALAAPHMAAEIARRMEERERRTNITQDRVLAEYAKLAFLDPRKFFDEAGNLIPVHELPADVAAALAGMDVAVERTGKGEDGAPEFATVRKIKFLDKKGALDSLARHLGMFIEKVELSGSVSLTERMERVISRGKRDD